MFNSNGYIEPALGDIIRLPNEVVLEVVGHDDFMSCKGCYYDGNCCNSPFVCGDMREDGRVMFKEI